MLSTVYIFEDTDGCVRECFANYQDAYDYGDQYLFDQGFAVTAERCAVTDRMIFWHSREGFKRRMVGRILECPVRQSAFAMVSGGNLIW